jgi:Gas vesicle synthesis protein GvpL/GvpF
MLYAYAITPIANPPGAGGLDGASLRTIGEDGLMAIVSQHEELPVTVRPEALWAHETVVEAAMEQGPVLPMRAGSSFASEAELRDAVRDRTEQFQAALARVEGHVELGVRALLDVEASVDAAGTRPGRGPGTAYLLDRLERARSVERLAATIHEPLAVLAREATWRLGATEPCRLVAAYLIHRSRVEHFRARVAELEEGQAATIVCTGPWPPYSFVAGEDR